MKTITFTIDRKTGGLSIKTEGYQGAECLEATKKFREQAGMNEPEPTQEMYQERQEDKQRV